MRDRLEQLRQEGLAALTAASDEAAVRDLEVRLLGRSGQLTALLKAVGALPPAERPAAGQLSNQVKRALTEAIADRRQALEQALLDRELSGAGFDPTLPGPAAPGGRLHPIGLVQRRLEDLFRSMGFVVVDGPEVELEENNFDALNIPKDHPARESQDTIWVEGDRGVCMRTHTSPVQIRALRRLLLQWRSPVDCG